MNSHESKSKLLPQGLYERLVYADEVDQLQALADTHCALVDQPTQTQRREHLIHEVSSRLPELLDIVANATEGRIEQARAELKLIAHLIREARLNANDGSELRALADPLRLLLALHPPNAVPSIPLTGLRRPWLFTSARSDPSLLGELRAELGAVDHVDILVSFITWSGVRKLIDVLRMATALDAQGLPRTRFRILTTTYIGATEARAVDALAELPGVELRISLDGRRTRLHAKAWIFHRRTGFGTAFVGSANLSESALIGGIEWTVKFTEAADSDLFSAAAAHFETLWNDGDFNCTTPAMRCNGKRLLKHFASNGISQDEAMEMKSQLRSIHGLNFALKRISLKCWSALHQSVGMDGGATLLLLPQERGKRLSPRLIINVARAKRGVRHACYLFPIASRF